MKTCPCCGAGIPELMEMSRLQRKIVQTIRARPGLSITRIVDIVYADDIDGGVSNNTLSVHLYHINKKLKEQGMRIGAIKRGCTGGIYLLTWDGENKKWKR